jgi:Ca2+-binding RTX toxin-like protein
VVGGKGNDHLQGNLSNDVLIGGRGDDSMDGDNDPSQSNPQVNEPAGDNDKCHGGRGADSALRCERTTGVP